jgi:hypothetical protein
VPREAPDVRETPTGGLVFPVGEEIFSAVGKMMLRHRTTFRGLI